jgi:hypothetical protein
MKTRAWVATCVALVFLAGLTQAAAAADAGRKKSLDLAYVPGDCFGAMVLHPQELIQAPAAAPMVKAMSLPVALDPASIDEVLILFPVPAKEPGPDRGEPSLVVRLKQAANTDLLAKEFLGLMGRRGGTVVEATVAGKKCYKFEAPAAEPPKEGQPPVPPAFRRISPAVTCGPDARTVLVALSGEDTLKKMLGGEAKGPLVERLRQTDVAHDVVLVFALEPVRELIKENLGDGPARRFAPPPILAIFDMLPVLQSATITADLNDDALGKIVLQGVDAAGTAKVEEQVKLFQQKLKEAIEEARKVFAERPVPEEFRAQFEKTLASGEKVVNAMTVSRTDAGVVVSLKPIKGIGTDLLEMMGTRMTPRRPAPPPPPPKPATPE